MQLTRELDTGISGNYWKVTKITLNRNGDSMEYEVALYKDEASRTAGKSPMFIKNHSGSATLSELQTAEDPVELAYTRLKELDEFSEATDV